MEVFRSLGGDLAAQLVQRSPPLDHWRSFVYCESVTGRLLGSVDHFPVRPERAAVLPGLPSGTTDADIAAHWHMFRLHRQAGRQAQVRPVIPSQASDAGPHCHGASSVSRFCL
jgi:hypothetical protein